MRVGLRTPSPKKIVKAKTTGRIKRKVKSTVNPFYGKKGIGYLKNPEKAIKNKIYHKVTFDPLDPVKKGFKRKSRSGQAVAPSKGIIVPIVLFYLLAIACEAFAVFMFLSYKDINILSICTSIICFVLFVLLYIRKNG